MATNQISPKRESDRIETQLRDLILSLELEPGLSISEATLMKRYGWGRTPLREACQRLSEQTLLQVVPRQGVTVAPLRLFDFVEVMDAMSLIIGPAAALACKRLSPAELARLEDIVAQAEQAEKDGHLLKFSRLDYDFHSVLANATGNRYLSRYLLHLHTVATRFNLAAWLRERSAKTSVDEHLSILNALRRRAADRAKETMRGHIENARQRIIGGLGQEFDEDLVT
jgi:DNA-binding GntR family transcriptional regulator